MTRKPELTPTTGRQVVVATLAGAVVGWMILSIFDLLNAFPPVAPWSLSVLLVLLGVAAIVPALEAVRAMVMAKSLIATGALLAGGHAVYVGRWVALMAAELPATRVWHGLATIVAAAFCAWGGWVLERACMIDGDGSDAESGEDQEASEAA